MVMTKSPYIVINPTGGLAMQNRFAVDSVVGILKQHGFIAISPVGRSKPHHVKTNPNKKSMIKKKKEKKGS